MLSGLSSLVKQSVYGGRVDSDFDRRILDSVDAPLSPNTYNIGFDFWYLMCKVANVYLPSPMAPRWMISCAAFKATRYFVVVSAAKC